MEPYPTLHKRETIATGLGWTCILRNQELNAYWENPSGNYVGGGTHDPLPKWFDDTDACHEAITALPTEKFVAWKSAFASLCENDGIHPFTAPASYRAEALYQIFKP